MNQFERVSTDPLNVFIRRWAKTIWRRESSDVSWKSKNAWIENNQLVETEPSKQGTLIFNVLDTSPVNQGGSLPPSAKSQPSNWLSLRDGRVEWIDSIWELRDDLSKSMKLESFLDWRVSISPLVSMIKSPMISLLVTEKTALFEWV